MLDIHHVAPNVLLKDAPFLLESVSPARMVRDDLYGALLENDHASSLEIGSGVTAEKSYPQPSDQRRDVITSIPGNVLRYPGLRQAGTSCD